MHFRKIVGKKVYLSPRSIEDASKYTEWLNNYEISRFVNQHVKTISIEGEREYLARNDTSSYNFAIVDNNTDELIGSISLMDINFINHTAELGIFIGDEDHLSKGYGSEAIMLLLNYGFNFLNLNNIMLKVFSFNKRAQKAYRKCGFKEFGVWKSSHFAEGKYHDEIFMNIMRDEFNNENELYK